MGGECCRRLGVLLPLDGCRGFGADVVQHAVDAFYFVEDAVGGFAQEVVGELYPVCGHGVFGDDGAEVGGKFVGAFVSFDTDGFDGDESRIGLPAFVVPSPLAQGADEDGVAVADDVEAFSGDFSRASDGQTGAGEGVTPEDVVGDAHGGSQFAYFVFEEEGQRFDDFALRL